MSDATTQQPAPTPASGDVWLSVIADMHARREFGIAKYGVPVQPFNGRKSLVDAFQEAIDLCVYLKQAIIETELMRSDLDVQLRRGWHVQTDEDRKWWTVPQTASYDDMPTEVACQRDYPVGLLTRCDAWVMANIEAEPRP